MSRKVVPDLAENVFLSVELAHLLLLVGVFLLLLVDDEAERSLLEGLPHALLLVDPLNAPERLQRDDLARLVVVGFLKFFSEWDRRSGKA